MRILRSGHPEPRVSICTPTLRADDSPVQALIRSVQQNTTIPYEMVVCDSLGEMRGYTAPQNHAMAGGQAALLLAVNDDVTVGEGWLEPLLAAVDAGAWCATPDMTHTDGPQVFAPYCMLWQADAWRELGGLDEGFVHWCSDIDIARRLVDAGHPPVRVRLDPPIAHTVSASSSGQDGLQAICLADLQRFAAKWGTSAEDEKHRLAEVCGCN